uniref:Kinesin motor domain-containing protein n=1 Tax=Percolomonas cosmopolitus TaxID=63605 RepID=A0A7S1KWE4_9EUKA|mmetsp:Transcript_9724/g.36153  ORF Transcript_9724/g.36153 Transcript_9724/m.36153 type:complete len:840 (+) Transcript_9724:351-2870(+)
MPRCIVRITPNYKFNATTTSLDQQWEYNTAATAKYFYESTDPTSLTIYPSNVRYNGKSFHFDKIYDSVLSQYDFYSMEIRDYIGFLVHGVLNGSGSDNSMLNNSTSSRSTQSQVPQQKDVCILFLGDQSSGERFVLHGPPEHPGLIYRSLKDVFTMLEQKNEFEMMRSANSAAPNGSSMSSISISCYYIEPSTDNLIDAFDASVNQNQKRKRQTIRLRDHPKRGIIVEGVSRIPIDSPESGVNLLNQIYAQNASQFQSAHVIVTINVETTQGASHSLSGNKKGTTSSSISFFSLCCPHDNSGGMLPRNKQPSWVKNFKQCLDGLQNRTPSIAFHKSKPTSMMRDLLVGNRAGLVIHALSPNIESYKQMLWNMNLCQKLVDVSPKTKTQLASPIQFRQAPSQNDMNEFMDEHERHNAPSPMPQTMRMSHDQMSFSIPASGHYTNPNWSHNDAETESSRSLPVADTSSLGAGDANSHQSSQFLRRSSSSSHQQLGSVPKSFMARSAQGGTSSVYSSASKTPQRQHPLKRNQSKLSISTSFSQNTFQDPSLISSPTSSHNSVSTNNFLSAQDAELLSKYKKESSSLKSELEILKRLKLTHQRKITQLEEKLDEFRNQHQDAIRSMKKYAKKGGSGGSDKNGSFSQKDFDMYREVMEQAITRMKETQSKLETQNDALKRHINKKDQDLRKKDKELIKLTRTQEEMQVSMEQTQLEKSQLEKKLKAAEKRITSLNKHSSSNDTRVGKDKPMIPDGFTLLRSDKIQKYEEYIKETVEFNEKLRQEVLKQAQTLEMYRKRYGNLSSVSSNMHEGGDEDSEESLKKQLTISQNMLADALKQLAMSKQ